MSVFSANILVPLIFVVVGGVFIYLYLRGLAKVRASSSWPSVQGTVLESWVRRSESTDSDGSVSYHYHPEVRYQYQVMGSEFKGERVAWGGSAGGGVRSAVEKVVSKYPSGAKVTVYYQPDKPENAVLERRISRSLLIMGILLIAAGIFFYVRWG